MTKQFVQTSVEMQKVPKVAAIYVPAALRFAELKQLETINGGVA